ncbi:hypothetical protein [Cronobacter sakazakii]|uniref:hypothetical protein n=1 Tax=Cronobacter sakazakii TaxID=28141 RepID=UPI001055E29D|nr:hypothetical protein [Cronobacter sakazakii]MEB8629953.1 hypothetical protein [Cronobacter sakazakii]
MIGFLITPRSQDDEDDHMSHGDNSDCAVFFTKSEMDAFNEEFSRELTFEQYESRIGDEIQIAEVLVDIVEDPPEGIPAEVYQSYAVFADKENPTALIISGENEDYYFRIRRPEDYSTIADTLQDIVQDRQNAEELERYWEEHRQWEEQNRNDE